MHHIWDVSCARVPIQPTAAAAGQRRRQPQSVVFFRRVSVCIRLVNRLTHTACTPRPIDRGREWETEKKNEDWIQNPTFESTKISVENKKTRFVVVVIFSSQFFFFIFVRIVVIISSPYIFRSDDLHKILKWRWIIMNYSHRTSLISMR